MIIELLTLLISIVVLSGSSALVIDNAVKLSRFFNINQMAVGFLLVAVATSLPELSVSVASSSAGEGAISAGTVFGSNIANVLVILGIGAFLYGVKISAKSLKEIGIVLLLTTILSLYIIYSSSVLGRALNMIEGLVLLGIFAAYVWWVLKSKKPVDVAPKMDIPKKKALNAFLMFVLGMLLVVVSSAFVVDSAVALAGMLGLAQSFIGATIIAVGTSLPELGTALQALRKRYYGLVLGNAIGSNMANLTLVLGTASVINPIELHLPVFVAALIFAVVANTLFFYVSAVNKSMGRIAGAFFILVYVLYLIAIFGLQAAEMG